MKKLLLLAMVVAVAVTSVGCSKENPPRPELPNGVTVGPSGDFMGDLMSSGGVSEKAAVAHEHAMEEWWGNLVVCVHFCGSDLVKKGAKVCAECGKDQRTFRDPDTIGW